MASTSGALSPAHEAPPWLQACESWFTPNLPTVPPGLSPACIPGLRLAVPHLSGPWLRDVKGQTNPHAGWGMEGRHPLLGALQRTGFPDILHRTCGSQTPEGPSRPHTQGWAGGRPSPGGHKACPRKALGWKTFPLAEGQEWFWFWVWVWGHTVSPMI